MVSLERVVKEFVEQTPKPIENRLATLSNGLRLSAGEEVYLGYVGNLASLYLDSTTNGEGVAWLALNI